MLKNIKNNLIGALSIFFLITNTVFWCLLLFPVTFLKMIFQFKPLTKFFNIILDDGIAQTWIACNNAALAMTRKIHWQVEGLEGLELNKWYLVLSNHQSWTDIVVLQKVFHKKIPFLKFFLKKELIWVPILGPAWWALDFPFMKRYTPAELAKKPHLKGKDIEITKKACAKYQHIPVSVMNFVEGTRLTEEKQKKQKSPFRNLLKPKSGGIGFVFSTMGEQLSSILNVTIAYPDGPYSFWQFLKGEVKDIRVHIEEVPVTEDLIGDYINDPVYREHFQQWLNDLWKKKDDRIDELLEWEGKGSKDYFHLDAQAENKKDSDLLN